MACRFCENFSIKSILTEDYKHQPSLAALQRSSLDGCDLCRLIWDSYVADQNAFGQPVVATDEFSGMRIKTLQSDHLGRDFREALGLVAGREGIRITFGEDEQRINVLEDLSLDLVAYEGLFKVPFLTQC